MKYDGWAVGDLISEAGRRIRAERLNQDLTQHRLAELAGISRDTLKNIETGQGNPTLRVVLLILRALGLGDRFDSFFPEPAPSPVQAAKVRGEQRQRASGQRRAESDEVWTW